MYDYKKLQEAGWFVFVAILTTLGQALVEFSPDKITDWRTWAVGIIAGCVRAGAGAALAFITKPTTS